MGGVCRFLFFGVMWEVMTINMDIDGLIVKNQTIQTIFADFALFAVTKIMHRKERKERKVFRIYVKYIMSLTIIGNQEE